MYTQPSIIYSNKDLKRNQRRDCVVHHGIRYAKGPVLCNHSPIPTRDLKELTNLVSYLFMNPPFIAFRTRFDAVFTEPAIGNMVATMVAHDTAANGIAGYTKGGRVPRNLIVP